MAVQAAEACSPGLVNKKSLNTRIEGTISFFFKFIKKNIDVAINSEASRGRMIRLTGKKGSLGRIVEVTRYEDEKVGRSRFDSTSNE